MSATESLVLVIEDEKPIRCFLRAYLERRDFQLIEAEDGEEGLALAAEHRPALVLLDLGLPGLDGVEVIRRLRGWSATPIIVISARGKEQDKVDALDAGADDYLTKPFGVAELAARMRVCLRHSATRSKDDQQGVYRSEELFVDLAKRQVRLNDREVRLTKIEFKLLSYLMQNVGKVVTHRQILKAVWDSDRADQLHYSRIYVRQLRSKIEPDAAAPRHLLTETGVGYRLVG
ncbi:MAG: response regulator [Humidesulfovibrio sp.]|uniref:response regulator n=1 Tax=Humidesulfovibrio sp. TaxID=2910988 RepID=UPI0027FFA62B|nr:response regulator [Humidesulfovibrio sp.]MDQ7836119.1 response regulator [Humidesulfovibrio sp.]